MTEQVKLKQVWLTLEAKIYVPIAYGDRVDVYKARLQTPSEYSRFSFDTLNAFIGCFDRLNKALKRANKKYHKVELEVMRTEWLESKQTEFDRWSFSGISDDFSGYYLTPDTRYTAANRDIFYEYTLKCLDSV